MTQLPSSPPSSDPSEESLKAAEYLAHSYFIESKYTVGVALLMDTHFATVRAQAAMAGELFDHLEQLWDHCIDLGENEDSEAGVAITALLARFSATKSTKEATSGDPTAEEMLDWLENNGPRIRYAMGLGKDKDEWVWHDHRGDYNFQPTVRQAIAAAMRGSKEAT